MYGVEGTRYITKCRDGYSVRRRDKGGGPMRFYGYGKTLIIALMKLDWIKAHDWTPYPPYDTAKYIYSMGNGRYHILKNRTKDGKRRGDSFGVYASLEEAEKEVRWLKSVDWDYDAWCDLH